MIPEIPAEGCWTALDNNQTYQEYWRYQEYQEKWRYLGDWRYIVVDPSSHPLIFIYPRIHKNNRVQFMYLFFFVWILGHREIRG